MRIWYVGGDNNSWLGAVFDYGTQKDTIIGTINVPKVWGYGLVARSGTFVEYASYPTCDGPCSRAVFSAPYYRSPNGDGQPMYEKVAYVSGSCTNTNVQYSTQAGAPQYYAFEAGSGVERTTPDGTTFSFARVTKPDPIVGSLIIEPSYNVGDSVGIGIPIRNAGSAPLNARVVANIIGPDGKTTAYDSHALGTDVQLQVPTGDSATAYFEWQVPSTAAVGTYSILYSVRDWERWDSIYVLSNGPSFAIEPVQSEGGKRSIIINASDYSGNALNVWVSIYDTDTNSLAFTGYTPIDYPALPNEHYELAIQNFGTYYFDHWSDGDKEMGKYLPAGTPPTTLTSGGYSAHYTDFRLSSCTV